MALIDCIFPRRIAALAVLASLAGCSAEEQRSERPAPLVASRVVTQHLFVDVIEAVGTANANEQVTISANVTERIERVLFGDSQPVQRGQLLAVLSQAQENAQLAGAVAAESQATAQYERINSLFERGFATRAQLDQQVAAAAAARASSAQARAAIGDRMIRAPFSGYTGLRTISAGAVVQAGTPLVVISDLSRIKLDFPVPETLLTSLRTGQAVEAVSASFPDQVFTGHIGAIDPAIDPNSRAVMVRALLPNPGARLKPGMLLTVRIRQAERMADAVPELAIVGEGDSRSVFVLDADNVAHATPVTTGLRDNGMIEVAGLPRGARIVTEGVLKVTDGMQVRIEGQTVASAPQARGN